MHYCYFKKSFSVIILLTTLLVSTGYAAMQQDTAAKARANEISGTVLDNDGRPLINVDVYLKGSTDIVKSDTLGAFTLTGTVPATLVFKSPNYNVSEVTVKDSRPVTVRLLNSYLKSPERIDILYGTTEKSKVLGAVGTLYTDQLTTTPASLYVYALPGQLAGLYTSQNSGFAIPYSVAATSAQLFGSTPSAASRTFGPVDNTEMSLSLRGQSPITVIDGVQREISSIDPESIESVSVLKDALSTIFLGINSSRGVLLITTKKPIPGDPRITFTAMSGVQRSLGVPDDALSADQYAYLYNEALINDGGEPFYTSEDFLAYRNNTNQYTHPNVDWFNTILKKTAAISAYRLNVTGGTEFARYTVSANYFQQDGIFKEASDEPSNTNNKIKRYIINSNVSVKVTKNLFVDLQLFGRIQQGTFPGAGGYNDILTNLYSTPNNAYPVRNADGSFGGSDAASTTGPYSYNLLAQSQYSGYMQTNSQDVLANLDLNYNLGGFIKGLSVKAKGNVSFQSLNILARDKRPASYLLNPDGTYFPIGQSIPQSNIFGQVATSRYSFGQVSLNYERQFDKHNISSTALIDFRQVTLAYALSSVTQNRALKVAYNYDSKYFVEGVVNNSGYNRYAPGKQFGWFYAFGLGWQMANESFIKDNIEAISSWKWRATYGRTGNANVDASGYYIFRQTYSTGNGGWSGDYAGYQIGQSRGFKQGYDSDALANPFITWEKADKFNVGVDIGLFKDKFMITADYYNDKYFDLVGVRGKSTALLGIPYTNENIGINRYYGGELTLTYKGNINNFNYFISANGSIQASKVVFADEIATGSPGSTRTGRPVGTSYAYEFIGFYKDDADVANSAHVQGISTVLRPGDMKYKDQLTLDTDGDGVLDAADGVINQFDQVPVAGTKPLIYYGSTVGFNYKGFSLSVIMQGVQNRMVFLNNAYSRPFQGFIGGFGVPGQPYGQAYQNAFNRWTPETAATATLPRLSLENNLNNDASLNGTNSSFYYKKANYFRIKNAEIGYTLPYSITNKLSVAGIRVFVNGENLFTTTDFAFGDPEVYNVGSYPIQRVISAGLTVKL